MYKSLATNYDHMNKIINIAAVIAMKIHIKF